MITSPYYLGSDASHLLVSQSDEEKVEAKNKGVQYKTDIANLEASYRKMPFILY